MDLLKLALRSFSVLVFCDYTKKTDNINLAYDASLDKEKQVLR